MSFDIRPATRQGIIPLVGFYGGTGGGKTMSALLFARGLAGPKGRVVVVDSENKRASYYTDQIPGGYSTIDFQEPFTPERYVEALDAMEKNSDVAVIDSCSHAWDGPDGVLDHHEQVLDRMCTKNPNDWERRAALNYTAWNEPKQRLKLMLNRILRFRIPLICCFQGETKTTMQKDDRGKTIIVTGSSTTPIFEKKFPFKMHVCMELVQIDGRGGFVRFPPPYSKTSHTDIRRLLPSDNEQLGIKHGEALAAWCAGGSKQTTVDKPEILGGVGGFPIKSIPSELKKKLWKLGQDYWGQDIQPADLQEGLEKKKIISKPLGQLNADELQLAIDRMEIILSERETA